MSLRQLSSSSTSSRLLYPLLGLSSDTSRIDFFTSSETERRYSKQVMNHYDVLGLSPKANQAQVKAAYYKLSKKFHPDVNKSPEAKTQFSNISEAYEILGNKMKRQQYDRGFGGPSTFTGGPMGSAVDVEYQEFLRRHGQFGKKGSAPTGKTNIYDFDEFYRVHYGESIKQKQASDEAKVQFDKDMRGYEDTYKKHLVIYSLTLLTLLGAAIKIL